MQNRQRHEIVRDLLTVCNGGSILSMIMFRSYLCYAQAKGYLAELIYTGFIEHDRLESKYITTPKGLEYLSALENIYEIMPLRIRKATASQGYSGP